MSDAVQKRRPKLPPWIRVKVCAGEGRNEVDSILKKLNLHTVCESARCPNLGECWHSRTATFMIMGDQCTRNCKFCAVKHNVEPLPLESSEPQRVAEAAKEMGLEYVVVTSVTRDDLPDGGAGHFAAVIRALKDTVPGIGVEVLTPDFNADFQAIETVLKEKPSVFNHNVETVERLAEQIRNRANYRRSLKVLSMAAELGGNDIPAKSGLMVGLGETDGEVETTICDLKDHGVSILTIGQYLPPTSSHWPLDRYVEPDKFNYWKEFALSKGFLYVASAPLVRSSYNAAEAIKRCGSD